MELEPISEDAGDLSIQEDTPFEQELQKVIKTSFGHTQLEHLKRRLEQQILHYHITSHDLQGTALNLASLQGQLYILEHLVASKHIWEIPGPLV